jgi:hypothetical protein
MSYILYLIFIIFLIFWIEGIIFKIPPGLIVRKKNGNDLEDWLKKFQWGSRQELGHKVLLPHYKFYTEVIEVLLLIARKVGGNYLDSFLFLRESLQADLQFEKKIKEAVWGIYLHMVIIMLLTWSFILSALSMVDMKVNTLHLVGIFLWQIIGLIMLPLKIKMLRKKYFSDIGKIWKVLLILKSLQKIPISQSEILNFAGINELSNITNRTLDIIVFKIKESCQKVLKLGLSYEDDLKYLIEELRFQEKWHFDVFEKKISSMKLILLSVFFLPSYLVFVLLLLRDLMVVI